MLPSFLNKLRPKSIARDLIVLAVLNGISGMALNGAAVFGILAILGGGYFLHGLTGVGLYVVCAALATFAGYAGICLYGARIGLKYRTALTIVFAVHAIGFVAAAVIHPICVALSAGLGLGMFYAVFMLKNINDITDTARDRFATLFVAIEMAVTLIAPVFGAVALYAGTKAGFRHPFFPAFLTFAGCVLAAIPLIRLLPDRPLPHSIRLPLKAVFERRHAPAIALIVSTIFCDAMMNPLFIISSFALLGQSVQVGWFAALVALLAAVSLFVSQRVRLTGQRWVILSICLLSIGLAFGIADLSFGIPELLVAGAVFAVARANYIAAWFAISSRVMEHEWGGFGKNRSLVLGEMFVLIGRFLVAGVLLACGVSGMPMRQSLGVIVGCFLAAAIVSSFLARFMDRGHKAQMRIV